MGWRPLPAKEDIMSKQVTFQVLGNLVYTADIEAGAVVTRSGISKKTGEAYSFTRWEAPLKVGAVEVGKITAYDNAPEPKLRNGAYVMTKTLRWAYTTPKFISVVEKDLVEAGFRKFYEDDQVSEKGNTNHVVGYDKAENGAYIKLWVYTNLADKVNTNAVRAKLELKTTSYVEAK